MLAARRLHSTTLDNHLHAPASGLPARRAAPLATLAAAPRARGIAALQQLLRRRAGMRLSSAAAPGGGGGAAAAASSSAAAAAAGGQDDKKAVRREIIRTLKALGDGAMAQQSASIAGHVLASRAFAVAQSVGVYIHCAKLHEVDTMPLLRAALAAGKRVYVPLVDDRDSNMRLLHIDTVDDMAPAPPFGILEPSVSYADGSLRENVMEMDKPLDLLLMPGLGFDEAGGRLGRGGGYYDKFVRGLEERAAAQGWAPPLLLALSFTEQLRPPGVIPMESHDRRVDAVATPDGLHLCSEAARRAEQQ